MNRMHEVVDVKAVADSAAVVEPAGGPCQEFGREARLPDGPWSRDDPGPKDHEFNGAARAQCKKAALCPCLGIVVRDRLATSHGARLVGARNRRLAMHRGAAEINEAPHAGIVCREPRLCFRRSSL